MCQKSHFTYKLRISAFTTRLYYYRYLHYENKMWTKILEFSKNKKHDYCSLLNDANKLYIVNRMLLFSHLWNKSKVNLYFVNIYEKLIITFFFFFCKNVLTQYTKYDNILLIITIYYYYILQDAKSQIKIFSSVGNYRRVIIDELYSKCRKSL